MSNYPSYMSFFLRSYSNVSHQNFLVHPASSGQLNAHRQCQFTLPTNANLHLDKSRLVFSMSSVVQTPATTVGRLAAAKSIIDRIQIDAGGVSLSSGCASSAVLQQCIDNMRPLDEDPVTSHVEFYRKTSGINAQDLSGVTEAYSTANNAQCFAIDLGPFFKTMSPNLLPTAILPTIQVTIYLSGNATVVSSCSPNVDTPTVAGAEQATYTIDNYRLMVSAYSIDDGVFDQTIATRLNSTEGLEAMFCNYESFSNTFTGGSTRVSSAASSLDKVIVAFRPSGYDGTKGAVAVKGYNNDLESGLTNASKTLDQPLAHGGAKFLNSNLNFVSPCSDLPSAAADNWTKQPNISVQVNNIRFPSYDARLGVQSYELLKEAYEVDHTLNQSLVEYLENRCQVAYKFNLPGSIAMRARSGLNLQGSNSSILIEAVGDKTSLVETGNIMVFVESSVVLKIMPGKQLMVIS